MSGRDAELGRVAKLAIVCATVVFVVALVTGHQLAAGAAGAGGLGTIALAAISRFSGANASPPEQP